MTVLSYLKFFGNNLYYNLRKVMVYAILGASWVIAELFTVEWLLNYYVLEDAIVYSIVINLILLFILWTHRRTMYDLQYDKWEKDE